MDGKRECDEEEVEVVAVGAVEAEGEVAAEEVRRPRGG